jgi:hemoglobin
MDIRKDIGSREDIDLFIRSFYENVKTDPVIGIIFTRIVHMDWEHHIPVIVNFWESILLDNPVYKRNAMAVHYDINKKYPLQPKHFKAWLQLFNDSLDKMYSGKIAELAKKRAAGIASLMQFKMANK